MNRSWNIVVDEFKKKNLCLSQLEFWNSFKKKTKTSQLTIFLVRLVSFIYTLSCLCVNYVGEGGRSAYYKLTHWSEIVVIVYLLASTISILIVICEQSSDHLTKIEKVLLRLSWVLQSIAINTQIIVFIAYWSFLAPEKSHFGFFSIHLHAILLLLTIINLIAFCYPIKILHFLFTVLVGFAYLFTIYITHITGIESAIYGSLTDWNSNSARVVLAVSLASLFGPLIINTFCFMIYKFFNLKLSSIEPTNVEWV